MDRLNDDEYKNWLKVGQGLLCLGNGLRPFTTQLSEALQKNVLTNSNLNKHSFCGHCTNKDIKFNSAKNKKIWEIKNPCGVCDKLLSEIQLQHQTITAVNSVHWANSKVEQWPSQHWQIAKVFMDRGQKDNTGPEHTDTSNLLSFIGNCKLADQGYMQNRKDAKGIKMDRNKVMHSATMTIKEAQMKQALDKMIQFLQDPAKLQNDPDAQQAVTQIQELKTLKWESMKTPQELKILESGLLQQRMTELEDRLRHIEEDNVEERELIRKACADFVEFVENNQIEVENFRDFKDLQKEMSVIRRDLAGVETRVGGLEEAHTRIERRINNMVEENQGGQTTPSQTGKQVAGFRSNNNYKGLLNEFAQKNGQKKPVYDRVIDLETDKFKAKVKVGKKEYRGTGFYRGKAEAEQEAAYQALLDIVEKDTAPAAQSGTSQLGSSQPGTNQPGTSQPGTSQLNDERIDINYKNSCETPNHSNSVSSCQGQGPQQADLASLLHNLGLNKALYSTQPLNGKFKTRVTMKIPNSLTSLPESVKGKKEAEQKVAKLILEQLGVSAPNQGYKNKLYAHCGESKLEQALYAVYEDKTQNQHFFALASFASYASASDLHHVEGSLRDSEAESVESAAGEVIGLLEKIKFAEVFAKSNPASKASVGKISSPIVTSPASVRGKVESSPEPLANSLRSISISENVTSKVEKNSVVEFNEYCQKYVKGSKPEIHVDEETGKQFRGRITGLRVNVSGSPVSQRKADAERAIALQAVRQYFPQEGASASLDVNTAKARLQELCKKYNQENKPEYDTHAEGAGGFVSEVAFVVDVRGDRCFPDKKSAKNHVAEMGLTILRKRATSSL